MFRLVVYSERNPFSLTPEESEPHKQSIPGREGLRGCDVPMFLADFHYASFLPNSFSIGQRAGGGARAARRERTEEDPASLQDTLEREIMIFRKLLRTQSASRDRASGGRVGIHDASISSSQDQNPIGVARAE